MGRPELPQERVQLGRAPLAAAGHTVAALILLGVVVVIRRVPVEALAALLMWEVGVDPAHVFLFNPINSMHNLNGTRWSCAAFSA